MFPRRSRVLQIANPSVAALYEDALVYETGSAITSTGALTAFSGAKTGRSPLDKRIVREPSSENEVWWGPVNKPMTPEVSLPFPFPCSTSTSHGPFGDMWDGSCRLGRDVVCGGCDPCASAKTPHDFKLDIA